MRKRGHKLSEQEILDVFHEKHGYKYQYRFPDKYWITSSVTITCPIHGEFHQRIRHHMEGQGCRKCGVDRTRDIMRLGRSEWIQRFESVHGRGKYDYSKIPEDVRQYDRIEIYCPEHDYTFYQTPVQHSTRKQGCQKCGRQRLREWKKMGMITRLDFEKKARAVHGLAFEYSELPYEFSLNDSVLLFCNVHNHVFFCKAGDHLKGRGCQC